jgi:hypothetical protein
MEDVVDNNGSEVVVEISLVGRPVVGFDVFHAGRGGACCGWVEELVTETHKSVCRCWILTTLGQKWFCVLVLFFVVKVTVVEVAVMVLIVSVVVVDGSAAGLRGGVVAVRPRHVNVD